ncbi:MAG: tetratricopeptide repeat protein [Flavobacteriales bacterium]|nr:tetratricopeptide repeat protein [Flavobacteriia bacterium]NCP04817.1 tetratricopeptide repeat protein [Flavobacteriales bacterium]PIV94309.1 MAG: aerotolerance regulator BatC [Flavobacteriaceae bacterium CG17_big_fil_post_rev_8_21_14_2_50_33_15]PIY11981.1 MAG: aerotolerance regulator BatC [Flavobacteriaceae bacterium CG_4_10_14_3_um_filter_33_47]PJB16261.1 MAG: aerotolerance regulator BatC [Flavobacteriaceae bacterium CG_4_9_14_3_um_filter_33_16]
MKNILVVLFSVLFSLISFSQEKEKQDELSLKKATKYLFEGNQLAKQDDFNSAEMEYRKAISENPSSAVGAYNLANAYYKKGSLEEALFRQQEVVETSTSKEEKHKAFHNIGNILMQSKKCKEAVEAYKNALRNNPTDDETRYNLGLAKECAEQQKDKEDKNKDNKDQEDKQEEKKDKEDQKDKEGDNKKDQKDKGDQDKKEGDDKKDEEGKPKEDKKEQDKGKQDEQNKNQQQPQPQPGKLSDQQIKSLLEAMNNQEQKVQEKMNAEKQKGVKVKTEKDW